jgi:hypothetical protein
MNEKLQLFRVHLHIPRYHCLKVRAANADEAEQKAKEWLYNRYYASQGLADCRILSIESRR